MGVKGATLSEGDEVVSMTLVKPGDKLLTVSENGFGKISPVDSYTRTHRGAKGVITLKTTDRNGHVVAVRMVMENDGLIITSQSGMVIRMQTSDIREIGRNTAGVRIMNLREGDRIVAVQPVPAVESAPVAEAPAEPVVEAEASEDGQ
jgi:DNA gyrase subunit A